jgi:hypothetical protein
MVALAIHLFVVCVKGDPELVILALNVQDTSLRPGPPHRPVMNVN